MSENWPRRTLNVISRRSHTTAATTTIHIWFGISGSTPVPARRVGSRRNAEISKRVLLGPGENHCHEHIGQHAPTYRVADAAGAGRSGTHRIFDERVRLP